MLKTLNFLEISSNSIAGHSKEQCPTVPKNRHTFSRIDPGFVDFPTPNPGEAVNLYHFKPLYNFQVANYSTLKVIGKNSFL